MVHALSEAQRVVRAAVPDADAGPPFARGVLDIRPRPSDPVVAVRTRAGDEVLCGPLRRLDPDNDHTAAAEQALAVAVQRSLFSVAAERSFDWVDEYETVGELVEDVEENWSTRVLDEDTSLVLVNAMERAGWGATPLIRQSIGLRFLLKSRD